MAREKLLIDHLRKQQKDKTIFYQLSLQYDYLISTITEFEFSVGSSANNRHCIETLLSRIPILAFDSACVQTAIEIYQ